MHLICLREHQLSGKGLTSVVFPFISSMGRTRYIKASVSTVSISDVQKIFCLFANNNMICYRNGIHIKYTEFSISSIWNRLPPNSHILKDNLRSYVNFLHSFFHRYFAIFGRYPESSIVKPISSPRTSIEKQRSFTRVRSMGAAAADSAQIRWLLVNSMRQFAPCATQSKYQIELKEDYTSVRD